MRTYTWDEYYEKFYDWAESTRVRNLSALTSLGSADEVGEIILELQSDVSASDRLLKKAVEAKLQFPVDVIIELFYNNDEKLVAQALYNSSDKLTAEDVEELYGVADDDIIIKLCSEKGIPLPEELCESPDVYDSVNDNNRFGKGKEKKAGFLGTLFSTLVVASSIDSRESQNKTAGCNGDCANCPPHYGYRYGRWYYGKNHSHGCEFGGNKGNGEP